MSGELSSKVSEVRRLRPTRTPPPFPARQSWGLVGSIQHAWNGLLHTVLYQRNMRIHVVSAVLVGLVGSGLPLGLAEKVTLIFCTMLVFFAEILNTALEHLVDSAVQQFDEKARVAKDAAAAGVLVLVIGTVVIFVALLIHNWKAVEQSGEQILWQIALGLPLAATVAFLLKPMDRPVWSDVAAFTVGVVLMVTLYGRTLSIVFSTMTASQLLLSGVVAFERQRLSAAMRRNAP